VIGGGEKSNCWCTSGVAERAARLPAASPRVVCRPPLPFPLAAATPCPLPLPTVKHKKAGKGKLGICSQKLQDGKTTSMKLHCMHFLPWVRVTEEWRGEGGGELV